ncbi:MAG TPA: hypothetical protein VKX28_06000 [Xanthobacteraceae bacterium]|nr:hypothetical protein [Xanthobacteraceae bacterium]
MRQPFILLIVLIFGLPLRVLAQDAPRKGEVDNDHISDRVCTAGDFSARSALIKDDEARRGDIPTPGVEKPQGLLAMLSELQIEADDRSYLQETAWTSATMTRQGPQTAIARLNPWFAARLASAIREARVSGLPTAGIFSAYRPPAFGIGRFLDRFASLHAYGLAVDMRGIGEPHSKEAKLWYEIAGRHGIFCPYGIDSIREWNHCQATPAKAVCRDNPLRDTITAEGPIDLDGMFKAGNWFVDNPPASCVVVAADRPANAEASKPHELVAASIAASTRSDRKHFHQARDVGSRRFTRGAHSSDEKLMEMVAHDMRLDAGLGPSSPKTRLRR